MLGMGLASETARARNPTHPVPTGIWIPKQSSSCLTSPLLFAHPLSIGEPSIAARFLSSRYCRHSQLYFDLPCLAWRRHGHFLQQSLDFFPLEHAVGVHRMTVFGELSTLSPRPNRVRAYSEQLRSFFDEDELVANGHLEPSEHAVSYICDLLKPYQ